MSAEPRQALFAYATYGFAVTDVKALPVMPIAPEEAAAAEKFIKEWNMSGPTGSIGGDTDIPGINDDYYDEDDIASPEAAAAWWARATPEERKRFLDSIQGAEHVDGASCQSDGSYQVTP